MKRFFVVGRAAVFAAAGILLLAVSSAAAAQAAKTSVPDSPIVLSVPEGYRVGQLGDHWGFEPADPKAAGPRVICFPVTPMLAKMPYLTMISDPVLQLDSSKKIEVNGETAHWVKSRLSIWPQKPKWVVNVWFHTRGDQYYIIESEFSDNDEQNALKLTQALVSSIEIKKL